VPVRQSSKVRWWITGKIKLMTKINQLNQAETWIELVTSVNKSEVQHYQHLTTTPYRGPGA
jgi:hypothetical protein